MPRKCRLTIQSNRNHIQKVFTDTREALKRLDSTLYHYVRAGHKMRKAAAELRRTFSMLDNQLTEKLKTGDRYL